MYKLELIWWNARKDIVLCSTFTMALLIVRELFVYQDLTDIIICNSMLHFVANNYNKKLKYFKIKSVDKIYNF